MPVPEAVMGVWKRLRSPRSAARSPLKITNSLRSVVADGGVTVLAPLGLSPRLHQGGRKGAVMQTYSAFYQHELVKLISEEVERRKEQLITASSTFDFPAYRHHVGIIEGLRAALDLCGEAERIINGGDRD